MESYAVCIRHPDITAFIKVRPNGKPAPNLNRLEESVAPKKTLMPWIRSASIGSDGNGIATPQESSVASWTPTIGSERTLANDEGDPTDEWGDKQVDGGVRGRDDQFRIVTSASQEAEELRCSGIPVEEIMLSAARRFDRYANTMVRFNL